MMMTMMMMMMKKKKKKKKKKKVVGPLSPATIIPFDILFDCIVPRLPVKSLLTFKCLSKSWRSVIDERDQYIWKLSHEYFSSRKLPKVVVRDDDNDNLCVYDIIYNTTDDDDDGAVAVSNETSMVIPAGKLSVASSCDGMLCLKEDDYGAKPYFLLDIPSGNMRPIDLPTSNMDQTASYYYELALLVREPASGKYKLLVGFKNTSSRTGSGMLQVWITTLEAEQKDDRWRCLTTNCTYMRQHKLLNPNRSALIFGAVFWVNVEYYDDDDPDPNQRSHSKRPVAVAFDITKEEFQTIALPDPKEIPNSEDYLGDAVKVHLAAGSDENQGLNLFYLYRGRGLNAELHPMEVWVLKEYDHDKPVVWTKRCVLDWEFVPAIMIIATASYVIGMFGERVLFASQEKAVNCLNSYNLRLNTFSSHWSHKLAGMGRRDIVCYGENLKDSWEFKSIISNSYSTNSSSWLRYKTFPLDKVIKGT